MDMITIFDSLQQWGKFTLIGGILLAFIYIGGYVLIYKKVFHGTKKISKVQGIVFFLLSCWILLVIALTTLSRGANYSGSFNINLFSGYINAWNKWSNSELQLIILNMLMFSPFGFLLPIFWRKAERFYVIATTTLAITGGIEMIQFLTGKGIFELDDLLHNVMGSVFGYFCIMAILNCVRQKRFALFPVLRVFILPCIVGAVIGGAILTYELNPYGNMPILPAVKQDMSQVHVETNLDFSENLSTASIYQNAYSDNTKYRHRVVEQIVELENVTFSRLTRTEGNTKVSIGSYSDGTKVQLTYFSRMGTWSYNNWKDYTDLSGGKINEHRQKYEDWLNNNGLLPGAATFTFENSDRLRWEIAAPRNLSSGKDEFASGIIQMQFDEQGRLATLGYDMLWNRFVTTEEIISPKQAYQEIHNGNFDQYVPFQPKDTLFVENYEISYVYDTKGYYQPVYQFNGYINERENTWVCQIPALK